MFSLESNCGFNHRIEILKVVKYSIINKITLKKFIIYVVNYSFMQTIA